jgi:hypothetical protein
MSSRWLPDEPVPVISTACGRSLHDKCETPHCGCLCHLNPLTEVC